MVRGSVSHQTNLNYSWLSPTPTISLLLFPALGESVSGYLPMEEPGVVIAIVALTLAEMLKKRLASFSLGIKLLIGACMAISH